MPGTCPVRTREHGWIGPLLLAVFSGMTLGVGGYTFGYANGASYLSNDPGACLNCHVMREQYEGWMKASHRKVAVCNDCHTPPGFVPRYATKALNGFLHSLAFTTGHFPDDIIITERNHRVAEASCVKCHAELTLAIQSVRGHREGVSCLSCHRDVGHGH